MSATVFDLDDLCDEFDPWEELHALKEEYPGLRVTLFAIPSRCSDDLLARYCALDWVELAVHGYHHSPCECAVWGADEAALKLKEVEGWWPGIKLFKAPGWVANKEVYRALKDGGWAVADNAIHQDNFGPYQLNRYVYNDLFSGVESVHGHTWDTCGNGPSDWGKMFEGIPKDQEFKFVSEACSPTKEIYANKNVADAEYRLSPIHGVLEKESVKEGDLFVDLGAYTGAEAKACLEKGMKVISFEPHPVFAQVLRGLLPEIEVIEAAAWNKDGQMRLFENDRVVPGNYSQSGSSLVFEKLNVAGEGIPVKTVDIGERLNGLDVRILKMNIEGAEWDVMERILDTCGFERIQSVYIEDHTTQIQDSKWHANRKRIIEKLRDAGVEWGWWE